MSKRPQSGFTLIELMVSLAIAGTLLAIGVPSFAGAIKDARLSKPWTDLRGALFLARSEAVKGSRVVSVCARATDNSCGGDDDWDQGWLVYVTSAGSAIGTVDEVLRLQPPIDDRIDIAGFGSTTRTAAGSAARGTIRYLPTGEADANWQNGYFVVCDDREEEHALGINIALTGDIRTARTNGSGEVVLDVFDREVDCP